MPRLSTRKKWVQLTLDFDTPAAAERDTTFTTQWANTLHRTLTGYMGIPASMFGTGIVESGLNFSVRRQPTIRVNQECRCPDCGAMPVALSMDNNLRWRPFSAGVGRYITNRPRVELTCHCGQHWFLPSGWTVVVRDHGTATDGHEVLLIEDPSGAVFARPPEQPYRYYDAHYDASYYLHNGDEQNYEEHARQLERERDAIQYRVNMGTFR